MEKSVSDRTKEEEKRNETPSEYDEPTFYNSHNPKATIEDLVKEFVSAEANQKDYKEAQSDIKKLFRTIDTRIEETVPHIQGYKCTPKYITINYKLANEVLYLIWQFIYSSTSSKSIRNISNKNSTNDTSDTDTDSDITCKSSNSSSMDSNISSNSNNSFPNNKIDEPARGMTVREY